MQHPHNTYSCKQRQAVGWVTVRWLNMSYIPALVPCGTSPNARGPIEGGGVPGPKVSQALPKNQLFSASGGWWRPPTLHIDSMQSSLKSIGVCLAIKSL